MMAWRILCVIVWLGVGTMLQIVQEVRIRQDRSETEAHIFDWVYSVTVLAPIALIGLPLFGLWLTLKALLTNPLRLGFKKKVHRDRAADIFIDHCHAEALKLKEQLIPAIHGF